jgi:LPS-assembly lipoprotein
MTRSLAFAPMLALLLATASACGLRPMYAGGSSGPVATSLRAIQVQDIPGKGGWLLRNALVAKLGGEGGGDSTHRLEVELDDNITGFGIRGDRATTRERRTLRARYRLVELATGTVVLDATAGSDAGIDVVSSQYATIAAEQTALERLSEVIADQMVGRLALYAARTRARP